VRLGRHRIYCADSTQAGILEKIIGSKELAAIVSDIPYNVSQKSAGLRKADYGTWDHGNGIFETFVILNRFPFVPTWLVSCSDKQLSFLLEAFKAQRRITRTAAWTKSNPSPRNGQYQPLSAVEVAAYGKLRTSYWGGHCDTLNYHGPAPHHSRRLHDTQKPLKMLCEWVRLVCPPGGLVLDAAGL